VSKKSNTLWFILGATVFNVLVTVVCFVILLVLFARLIMPSLSESAAGVGIPVIFIGSIVLSFVIYRFILKRVMKKIDMDKYFDPIFGGRKRPRGD